jgi:iron complex outermembrane receptor protein
VIRLEPQSEEFDDIVVATTRSSRTIKRIPTRIEVISAEELDEAATMNSANIAHLLRETTGIIVQQTSPASATASIRMHGLDGRYTQILKDGLPLYSGFSSTLSIMQIPPLDIQQVEVIKGSNSTLYGGGAIGGIVNLISKRPGKSPDLSVMLNQTSAKGTTMNGFYAQDFGRIGLTLYGSGNAQESYDPENDDFSNIPRIRSLSFNPTLFWGKTSSLQGRLAINSTVENRSGGGKFFIPHVSANQPFVYQEDNESTRLSYQFELNGKIPSRWSIKNSAFYFDRYIGAPQPNGIKYQFRGRQTGTFTEVTTFVDGSSSDWVIGGNLVTDNFIEQQPFENLRNYSHMTFGKRNTSRWFIPIMTASSMLTCGRQWTVLWRTAASDGKFGEFPIFCEIILLDLIYAF